MLIGIDASRTAKQLRTGTETYSTELIRALAKIDSRNDYILYSPRPLDDKLPNLGPNFKVKVIPFGKFWTQIRLSWEMLVGKKPDVLFVPAHTLPLIMPKKTVVTLHDVGFKHFPELYSKTDLRYHSWAMAHSAKHATKVIAISEFTKKDIIDNFHTDPNKIKVIYEAYDKEEFQPLKDKSPDKPYLLFIGRLEEKKNIVGMIKAYGLLRENTNIKHQFILAGSAGFGYEKIKEEIGKLPDDIAKDIILPGYISQEKYVELLKSADILFFCTFFEGFGLPPLEAMACGVPVVASNRTSIPEVCGEAALLVDPENPEEMKEAIEKIIKDNALREDLIQKGLKRAQEFSWDKCARETLDVIESTQRI